jgi:YD repeat-containing protein
MLSQPLRLAKRLLSVLAASIVLATLGPALAAQTLCQEDPTMCEAPAVSFAPATAQAFAGSATTHALQVTIHWCSTSPMQASTREIRFNGTLVTGQFSYTTGAYAGCSGAHASSTGTVQLRAGSNTLAAYITNADGLEGAGSAVYAYSYTAPPAPTAGIAVTPDAGAQRVADALPAAAAFQLTNTGTGTASYAVAAVCTGAGVSGCAATRGSVSLAGGESTAVGVTFRAGTAGASATVQLTAWMSDAAAVRDSGSVAVTVTNEPPAGVVGEVEAQVAVSRALCLTAAIGEGTAYECADLRAAHDLPATRILNRSRAPTLLYNSQHARPVPVVGATVSPPAGTTPDSVKAVLTVGGIARASGAWPGWAGGTSRRITLGFPATGLTTGVHDYTLSFTTKKAGVETALTSRTGRMIVVDRSESPFGRGWWLAGLEQIRRAGRGPLLWIGGDGSAKLYTPTGQTGRWTAASLTRPDTLKTDTDPANVGGWVRELPGGARVVFNSLGQHIRTWDALGRYTEFVWSGTGLTSIRLSRTEAFSTGYAYTFEYGPNGILSRVVAPYARVAGDRTTTVVSDAVGQVTAITDPDGTTVRYAYSATSPGVLTRRTNRLGVPTDYAFDPLQRVVRVEVDRDSTPGIATTFTPQETLGRPGTPAVAPASLLTTIDGPRIDVADVTTFRLDRFGAPVQVTDALGATTKVVRGDERFPALVTYARGPTGAETSAVFDGRGNLVASTDWSRAAGVATTLYEWDARWDEPTRIVSPTGITTRIAYDPATGHRLWEQTGQDSARRVRYTYRPSSDATAPGLVESVRTAAAAARGEQPLRVEYDALGNLRASISPLGIRSEVLADRIGRDTLSLSPDAPATRTIHGIADDVLETVTVGGRDTLRVTHEHDAEGRTLATTRRMRPDSAGIGAMTLRWRYDRVGRQRAAVDVYGAVDSLEFNPAGQVTARITRRRTEQGETVVTMRYDALGRLVEKVTPSLLYPRRDFVAFGQEWRFPSRPLDPDAASSERRIPGDTVRFTYDLAGNLRAADNRYARIRRTYHLDGSLATDSLRIRSYTGQDFAAHAYALAYTYDLEGRRARLTMGSGLAAATARDHVLYAYDTETGALAAVHDLAGNAHAFRYDADGQLVGRDMPGGVTAGSAYDADGMLSSYGITRDTLPNAPGGLHTLLSDTLTRDRAGRVTQSRNGLWRFSYNGMGALTASDLWVKDGDERSAMVLDALGNVLSDHRRVRDETVSDWPSDNTRTYGYDRGGRQVEMESRQRIDNELTEQAGWFYDAAGNRWWFQEASRTGDNRTAQERTHSYYDAEDRLWAVDRQRCHTQVMNGGGVNGQM